LAEIDSGFTPVRIAKLQAAVWNFLTQKEVKKLMKKIQVQQLSLVLNFTQI
jgi:hypothetical protein